MRIFQHKKSKRRFEFSMRTFENIIFHKCDLENKKYAKYMKQYFTKNNFLDICLYNNNIDPLYMNKNTNKYKLLLLTHGKRVFYNTFKLKKLKYNLPFDVNHDKPLECTLYNILLLFAAMLSESGQLHIKILYSYIQYKGPPPYF